MATFEKFQGGTHVELFDAKVTKGDDEGDGSYSARSRDGVWRGRGARTYDARSRGYVVNVRGELRSPQSERGLNATQGILVFQCYASASARFSFEVSVADVANGRRRLVFSSSFSEVKPTPLHCQVPLRDMPRDEWVNVLLPLAELVPACFENVGFKAVESVAVRGECRIRKIFTLRGDTQAQAWSADARSESPVRAIVIPRECDFPSGVRAAAHTVIPSRDAREASDGDIDDFPARARGQRSFKLAFGRRAPANGSHARDRDAMAPASAPRFLDDSARERRRANDARWSNLDQIMSNLRVRDGNARGRESPRSRASSASSYRSSSGESPRELASDSRAPPLARPPRYAADIADDDIADDIDIAFSTASDASDECDSHDDSLDRECGVSSNADDDDDADDADDADAHAADARPNARPSSPRVSARARRRPDVLASPSGLFYDPRSGKYYAAEDDEE